MTLSTYQMTPPSGVSTAKLRNDAAHIDFWRMRINDSAFLLLSSAFQVVIFDISV